MVGSVNQTALHPKGVKYALSLAMLLVGNAFF